MDDAAMGAGRCSARDFIRRRCWSAHPDRAAARRFFGNGIDTPAFDCYSIFLKMWRDGRAVDGAGLENQ